MKDKKRPLSFTRRRSVGEKEPIVFPATEVDRQKKAREQQAHTMTASSVPVALASSSSSSLSSTAEKAHIRSPLQPILDKARAFTDHILPPSHRAALRSTLVAFATARPHLATLLLVQLAFSGVPLLLFLLLAVGTLVFSLVTALVVGALGAVLFTAFWVGAGVLFVLVPVLCLTAVLGLSVWGGGWVGYYLVLWVGGVDLGVVVGKKGSPERLTMAGISTGSGSGEKAKEGEQRNNETKDGFVERQTKSQNQDQTQRQSEENKDTDADTDTGAGKRVKEVNHDHDHDHDNVKETNDNNYNNSNTNEANGSVPAEGQNQPGSIGPAVSMGSDHVV